MTTSGGDISKENLKQHGIIYDEKVYAYDHQDDNVFDKSWSELPDHVDALREALLAFSGIIPKDWKKAFDDEYNQYGTEILGEKDCLQPSAAAYFNSQRYALRNSSQRPLPFDENIERCKKIAEVARHRAEEAESGWTHFLRSSIFGEFDNENSSRTKIDYLFDQWSLQENFRWFEFQDWQESNPKLRKRKDPKPDLTYGFPIIRSPEVPPKGFIRDEYIQSFSLQVLKNLRSNGVHSAPTTGLRKWTEPKDDDKLKAPDLLCYPWAIVEMKHSKVSPAEVRNCYCQAANASAAALSLQEQLLARAFGTIPSRLSPIIAFTCIGSQVKVWLTYRWKDSEEKTFIKMSCIWSTSLELTWGVMTSRCIVENMHIWSSRILKPKIAVAISQATEKLDESEKLSMRTPGDEKYLLVSTPPATPSPSRNRPRSHTRSPSVLSRQATTTTKADGDDHGQDNTDEEFKDRRGLALTLLPGVEFAKLDIIDEWFEGLPSKQRVKVIWKLIDPSNGGLLESTRKNRERLQRLIDTLNEALDEDESGNATLTLTNFRTKKSGDCIRRGLRELEPKTLKVCLRRCLRLHNDETHSIHKIIADDLETLSDEDREQMEEQASELLNSGDRKTDISP